VSNRFSRKYLWYRLADFNTSYSCHIETETVNEENGTSAAVVLPHNGFGGNNTANDVKCTSDSYAVTWSEFSASVYIQQDYDNLTL